MKEIILNLSCWWKKSMQSLWLYKNKGAIYSYWRKLQPSSAAWKKWRFFESYTNESITYVSFKYIFLMIISKIILLDWDNKQMRDLGHRCRNPSRPWEKTLGGGGLVWFRPSMLIQTRYSYTQVNCHGKPKTSSTRQKQEKKT